MGWDTKSKGLSGGAVVKNLPANDGNARNAGSIPRSERSPAEGHGNPLQYPCLVNSMNRGASQATDHGVLKSWTRLSTHIVKETYKLSTLNLPFPSAHRYIDTMMMLRKPDCLEATLLRLEVVVEFRSPEF